MLLNLTAAFDTVQDEIILEHLSQWVEMGMGEWFYFYLKDRSSVAHLGNYFSNLVVCVLYVEHTVQYHFINVMQTTHNCPVFSNEGR